MRHPGFPPIFLLVAGALGLASPASAGVHVAVTPALLQVEPNQEFQLELTVPEPDGAFNAYDATVEFDPAVLTFVPESPTSLQEGDLMTGACGATFHRFAAAGDSLAITDVLLCAAISLTGPGEVYRVRFRAGAVPGVTFVRLRPSRVKFYNAGLFVLPVTTSDAEIHIGSVTDAGDLHAPHGLSLRAQPNPARAGTTLRIAAPTAGRQQVSIYDARGRLVYAFAPTEQPAGMRDLAWDGRDVSGRRVRAGQYTVVLRLGDRQAISRVTFIHS
jgi:hypothetical protein